MGSKNITVAENLVVKSSGSVLVVIAPDKYRRVRGYSMEEIEDLYVTLLAEMSDYLDSLNEDDIEPWMWQVFNWNKATEDKINTNTISIRGKNGEIIAKSFTREVLLQLCNDAIVQESSWSDPDTTNSQLGVGACWALLKAGCEYKTNLDDYYIHIHFKAKDSIWFERSEPVYNDNKYKFYLPTRERLNEAEGKDWY